MAVFYRLKNLIDNPHHNGKIVRLIAECVPREHPCLDGPISAQKVSFNTKAMCWESESKDETN